MTKLRWFFVLLVLAFVSQNRHLRADPSYCFQLCGPDADCGTGCIDDNDNVVSCEDYGSGPPAECSNGGDYCNGGEPIWSQWYLTGPVIGRVEVDYQDPDYGYLDCYMEENFEVSRYDESNCGGGTEHGCYYIKPAPVFHNISPGDCASQYSAYQYGGPPFGDLSCPYDYSFYDEPR